MRCGEVKLNRRLWRRGGRGDHRHLGEGKKTKQTCFGETNEPGNGPVIAHHGGNNTHFYRVLEQCKGKVDLQNAYMLLSHEVRSLYRPNDVFRIFIENIATPHSGPELLFTSAPRLAAVRGFERLIATPTEPPVDSGDVGLEFDNGAWTVVAHAISGSNLK